MYFDDIFTDHHFLVQATSYRTPCKWLLCCHTGVCNEERIKAHFTVVAFVTYQSTLRPNTWLFYWILKYSIEISYRKSDVCTITYVPLQIEQTVWLVMLRNIVAISYFAITFKTVFLTLIYHFLLSHKLLSRTTYITETLR